MFSTIEYEVEGTPNEIEEMYQLVMADTDGLNQKEWADFRDNYYMGDGSMNPDEQELLEKCNGWQKLVINQIKLAKKHG